MSDVPSLCDRYVASMVLSGVEDALGYCSGRWEFNNSGPDIQKQLADMGGLEKLNIDRMQSFL